MTATETIGALVFLGFLGIVYLAEVRLGFIYVLGKVRGKLKKGVFTSKWAWAVHFLAVVGVMCFLWAYFVEPYRVEVSVVRVETEKIAAGSFRIVQISDTHCDVKGRNEEKVVGLVNSLGADVVVFTGDAVNTGEALGRFKGMLGRLEAKLGKFAVRGNHDVWYWGGLDLFGGTGFKVLDGETAVVVKDGEEIRFSGIGYGDTGVSKGLLGSLLAEGFNVLLYHTSDIADYLKGFNVDLYLAGHTHGGQVALPFYGAIVTLSKNGKKYEAGQYDLGGTVLYVNRGIGMERGLPVRFWARPEVTVIDVVAKMVVERP